MSKNQRLANASFVARLLDKRFKIFKYRFGIDPLLGLIPGIGDILSFFLSLYLLWIAYQLKLPKVAMRKMLGNILVDLLLGTLPVIGDVADFFYMANKKNFEILNQYCHQKIIEAEIVT